MQKLEEDFLQAAANTLYLDLFEFGETGGFSRRSFGIFFDGAGNSSDFAEKLELPFVEVLNRVDEGGGSEGG